MPPSPSLSIRIANDTYLTAVMMMSVQVSRERMPRMAPWSMWPSVPASTVFIV